MPANSPSTAIDKAALRLAQLKARQERLDARLAYRRSAKARKDDTRRRILVGATILAKVEAGEFDSRTLRRWLDEALTRRDDRELFDL